MDFFSEFPDLNKTPSVSKFDQSAKREKQSDSKSNKGHRNDELDDLLNDLASKEEKKKSRRNPIDTYSSQNLGPSFDNLGDFASKNDPFSYNRNIESNIQFGKTTNDFNTRHNNKLTNKSILDELMSDDDKSYKSGATSRRPPPRNPTQNNNFSFRQPIVEPESSKQQSIAPSMSRRSNSRPPRNRQNPDSRENSMLNDDNRSTAKIEDLEISSPKKRPNTVNPISSMNDINYPSEDKVKFDLSYSKEKPSMISHPTEVKQKIVEKIVHIKEENTEVKKRYEEEIKTIKQSYERQIETMKANYEKIISQERENQRKQQKTYQLSLESDRQKWEKISKAQVSRVKDLYEWESKKKAESYETEVQNLKRLLDTITKASQETALKQTVDQKQTHSQFEINSRLKELQKERQRLQSKASELDDRKRQLDNESHDFEFYRKSEENKLMVEKKKLFEIETELKKREIEQKKEIMLEKQSLSTDLVNHEIVLSQSKESLKYQRQQLKMEKELFERQKEEYAQINQKVVNDLKVKQRQIEDEKQYLNELEIQVYRKINLVEMMGTQKGLNSVPSNGASTMTRTQQRIENFALSNKNGVSFQLGQTKENMRYRANSAIGSQNSQLTSKISETKNRYQEMENWARSNTLQRQALNQSVGKDKGKVNLEKYMERLGRDKIKSHYY